MTGNLSVVGFFLLGAISFATVALRFWKVGGNPQRHFGLGVGLFAVSFVIWAYFVGTKPAELELYITLGVLPFVAGFLALVSAATFDWLPKNRMTIFTVAILVLAGQFVLRTWVMPSAPGFSQNGLIYFHAQPLVQLIYALIFAGGFMTSLHVVSSRIPNRLTAALTRIFFNLVVVTGLILLVSTDDTLQYYNGNLMGAAFIGLLVVYLPGAVKGKIK